MGTECDPVTKKCVPGGQCGGEVIQGTLVAPNILIVLDRSCSMQTAVNNKPKWTIAVDAIKAMTTSFNGKVRFGLTMFPDTDANQCTQAAKIPIPVAPGNEVSIQTTLTKALQTADPNYPDGPCVTNIDTAVQQAATEPAFKDNTRKSFALLLTDGAQAGCSAGGGDPGTVQTIGQMKQAGVSTFVVGFGGAVDKAALDSFAVAGGVPVNGPNKYYDAADQKSLDKALQTIASQTLGCTFKLGKVPPDPSKLFVFADKVQLPRDPNKTMGWEYDPQTNSVTIYGKSCDDLKVGVIKVVDIVYGCPKPPVN
jgi:hypothetical protein